MKALGSLRVDVRYCSTGGHALGSCAIDTYSLASVELDGRWGRGTEGAIPPSVSNFRQARATEAGSVGNDPGEHQIGRIFRALVRIE